MIEALVITLREGIEAALVIGIILAYLRKVKKDELNKYAYIGLIFAVIASIVGAITFNLIGFDPENEVLEGIMYFTAAIFVGSMVIWMQKTSKNIKSEMEGKLDDIVKDHSNSDSKKQGIGILAFTFFMVFREGIETVLFMAALTSEKNAFMSFLGGTFGIALSVLFAIFFIKGSLKINISKFFNVTSWILMLLVVRLFAGGLHEFSEVRIIPMNHVVMKILGIIVRDNSTVVISMMLLTLPIVMILLDGKSKSAVLVDEKVSSTEKRKKLAEIQKDKQWRIAVIGAVLTINAILGVNLYVQATKPVYDPNPVAVTETNGEIKIPLAKLTENIMSKFSYDTNGTNMRFILVKGTGNTVSSGLDACDICGTAGYMQEEGDVENLICKNCNAPIPMTTVGYPGGCNPIPLKAEVVDDNVIVKVQDATTLSHVFAEGRMK